MVLITRCCCWNSVRKGSFASGIFTLGVYLLLFVTSVFHVNTVADSTELLILNIFCLVFSFFCVVSSVILLVGLCVDNRLFLLPWVASVSASTTLELVASLYFLQDTIENPWLLILFVIDILFCLLSVYCIVCVISQYQQYLLGRGRAGQHANGPPIPTVRFQPSTGGPSQIKNVPSISYQVTHQNGTYGRNMAGGLLTVPSANSSSMSNKSMGQTDMSSISDDVSSCEVSRCGRSSTDEDDEDSCGLKTLQNSVLLRKMNKPPSIILESDESAISEENQNQL